MIYRTIDDRRSGGCYDEEDASPDHEDESSEEVRRHPGSRYSRFGKNRSRMAADDTEDPCWS